MNSDDIVVFCGLNGVELLVLFGSRAAHKPHGSSDVDVAVKLKKGATVSKLDLISQLHDFFGAKEIDLVVLTPETDPLLLHEIFSGGTALHEDAAGIFEGEKLRAWKLFLDTAKLRVRQREYLRQYVERGCDVTRSGQ